MTAASSAEAATCLEQPESSDYSFKNSRRLKYHQEKNQSQCRKVNFLFLVQNKNTTSLLPPLLWICSRILFTLR